MMGAMFGVGFLGGMVGAGIGGVFLLLTLGNAIVCAIAGAIGGAISA